MFRWIGNVLSSSVGRKIVLALTGLLLVGFLIEHLVGNFTLYVDDDGSAFNGYVDYLKGFGPLLIVAELGLALLFACHIIIALKLTLENREARKQGYVARGNRGGQTPGSVSMHVTGALLLLYIIKHLVDFRFDGDFMDDPALAVRELLAQPLHGFIYLAACVVVFMHLSHGFKSAFQSIGISHPKLTPILSWASWAIAIVIALGFASFPIYYLFIWSEGA